MLANLFRSTQPIVLTGLLVLVPALYLPAFLHPSPASDLAMPFHDGIMQLGAGDLLVQGAITLFLVWLISVQVAYLVNNSELMDRRTQLPALLFPLLLAAFGPVASLDPTIIGLPFVLAALARAWEMNNTGKAMNFLFDAGLLLGLASLVYLPYLFLVVVIWASISVIRPFQWREYIVPLLGAAVVLYLSWGVHFLLTDTEWRPLLTVAYAHPFDPGIHVIQASQRILLWMVLSGFLFVGILSYSRSYRRGIMRQKNLRSAFLAFTAALAILMTFDRLVTGIIPPVFVALPLTVFCAHALQEPKKQWVAEAGIFSLLILALWAQWGW